MRTPPFVAAALGCLSGILCASAVLAQVDLSGNWVLVSTQSGREHATGPYPGDFSGIPLNVQGRQAGWAYSGDERQELYRQCEPWSVSYIVTGPWGGRFTAERDHYGHVIAWHLSSQAYDRLPMTIWMDGRAQPPPQALHTYDGFTTGHWEGNTLVTHTTHLKDSFLERNGAPASSQETVNLFWTRHDDELSVLGVMRDPVYLEAPWPVTQTFRLTTAGSADIVPEYCEDAEIVQGVSDGYHSATVLPDQLPAAQHYMQQHYNIPLEASQGGAATMYPEFSKRLAKTYKTPTNYCTQYCCTGRDAEKFCKNSNN
ncbi:MAG TPA: hypothetical protein VN660_08750 [Steroidobacteraceae bacterium]|nr:hypothetical protein [Steroidobacteraceae bacterium]